MWKVIDDLKWNDNASVKFKWKSSDKLSMPDLSWFLTDLSTSQLQCRVPKTLFCYQAPSEVVSKLEFALIFQAAWTLAWFCTELVELGIFCDSWMSIVFWSYLGTPISIFTCVHKILRSCKVLRCLENPDWGAGHWHPILEIFAVTCSSPIA